MNIKFIRNIFLSIIVCLLLVSCEGKDCIEADDFGEYDTDVITIESKTSDCGLNSSNITESSPMVQTCMEAEQDTIKLDSSYKIESSEKNNKINCYELYSCSFEGGNCYSAYKVVNSNGEQATDSDGKEVKVDQSILQKAYSFCSENCIKECLTNTNLDTSFETGWVPNNKKDDKNGLGIRLPLGQTVDIQVVGNVKLTEASQQEFDFRVNSSGKVLNKIDGKNHYFRDNLGPIVSGGWCFGDNKDNSDECLDTTNPERRWIGEINGDTENLEKRYEFLRRGVVILTRIPEKGKIDENNNYTGPDLFPDYSKWNCDYNSENQTVNCKTNYDSSDYKTENDKNFAMDNDFVKVNGGLVVPQQVSKLILSRPPILSGSNKENISITETDIILDNTSSNAYKFKKNQNIKSLHPVKLAFSAPDSNIDNCQIIINNNEYVININSADKDNWFFASDTSGKPIIFNENKYNTLKLDKSNDTMDWNSDNMFNIVVNAENCEKDGTYIPIYVFVMPQNEILINKSGFISFKTLLGNFEGQEIKFDIINPIYTNQNGNYLKDNFYEYIEVVNEKEIPITKTVALKNNEWSNEVFVRKGQILRFDNNNWFNIIPQNNSGSYTINRKTSKINNDSANLIGIGDTLVLKIEYRPALLCSGTAEEKIDNPDCSKKKNNDGTTTCLDTRYTSSCNDNTTDYYCPMGCYCKKTDDNNQDKCQEFGYISIAEDIMKDKCVYDKKATSSSCSKCSTELAKNPPSPTNEIELIQCYDLENYKGAVRNLFDKSNLNKLSDSAKSLGAKKLVSIFEGGTYGNLDGMVVDTLYKNFSNLTFREFKYNSPFLTNSLNPKINSANKYLSFLIINNKDFEFSSNVDSAGKYNLIFNPEKRVSNGEQLAIALVNGDSWLGYSDLSESHEEIDDEIVFKKDVAKFMGWIVKYNTNKNDQDNYGSLVGKGDNQGEELIVKNASSYLFDNNGYINNLKINIPINNNETTIDTSNLRLFFKIIDKPEEKYCNNDKTKTHYEKVLCKCTSGKNSDTFQSCDTLTCDPDSDNKPIDVETTTEFTCANSYYNNDGSYTVKLRTPKDTTHATSYIVKYIMKPILEILDGKSIALQVDNDNKLMPCESDSATFIYGGNLPRWRVGTVCSPGDPLVGEYCKKATFTAPGGTCDECVAGQECDPDCKILKHGDRVNANVFYKGAYALLPGAREKFWGKDCETDLDIKESEIFSKDSIGVYPNYCYKINDKYIYGGDLSKARVGTACDSNDPLVEEYCKKATFTAPGGTCDECVAGQECDPDCKIFENGPRVNANVFYQDNYALLPGAREKFWGKDCSSEEITNSKILEADYGEYPNYCYISETDKCAFYFPESEFSEYETRFGESCNPSDNKTGEPTICYKTCAGLDDALYNKHCKYFNNGGGFLQRFYIAVITDNYYQAIVKLCFTLMITFYGMYYLMGMAELTHGELIKRAFKISFIYLMIGTKGWEYYNMFFVKFFKQGMDYLAFAVASAFDDNTNLMRAFIKGDFYDKSVLFSGVDKNLSLLFSDAVSYKIWGLFFVSFFGWLYVFIIYSSILTYIFSVANAMLLYVTAQFFLSLLLAMGPIFLVMLIFDKTKEMFSKWISNLISFGLEQIFLLTCLSLFNILVYNIIKYVLSFRVCWKTVWEINIPLLGSLQMMSFWKATTSTSATAAATAVPGLFQILLIYLIADLMSKFIELSAQLGGSIGGSGMYLNYLSDGIKNDAGNFYKNHIKDPIQKRAKDMGTDFLKQTIGYKTADDEKKESKNSKIARSAFRDANYKADRAVSKYIKENSAEWVSMSTDERRAKIADIRKAAFIDTLKQNGGEAAIKSMGLTYKDENGKEKEIKSAEDVYNSGIIDKDLQVSHSLLGRMGKQNDVLKTAGKLFQNGKRDSTKTFGRGLEHMGDFSLRTLISPHHFGQGVKNLTVSTLKDGKPVNNTGGFVSPRKKDEQIQKGKSNIGDLSSRQITEAAHYEAKQQGEDDKPTGLRWFNLNAHIKHARDVRKEAELKEAQFKKQYNQNSLQSYNKKDQDDVASNVPPSDSDVPPPPPSEPAPPIPDLGSDVPSSPPDPAPNDGDVPPLPHLDAPAAPGFGVSPSPLPGESDGNPPPEDGQ